MQTGGVSHVAWFMFQHAVSLVLHPRAPREAEDRFLTWLPWACQGQGQSECGLEPWHCGSFKAVVVSVSGRLAVPVVSPSSGDSQRVT